MVRYNSNDSTTIAITAVTCSVSLVAVALRLIARTKTKAGFGLDDIFAILATVFYFAFCSVFVLAVENGLGYDMSTLPLKTQIKSLKADHASASLAMTALFFADLSILALYRRSFRAHKKLQIAVYIVGAICLAWWIGLILGLAFICLPVESSWNPSVPGKCFGIQNINIAIGIPNSIIDVIIVTMPIKVIKDLQLPSKQKTILCFVFLLGGLVAIINVIRMVIYYHETSIEFRVESDNWLEGQIAAAILCISLPTLRPLLPQRFSGTRGGSTSTSWKWPSTPSPTNEQHQYGGIDGGRAKRYRALSEDNLDKAVLTRTFAGAASSEPNGLGNYPMNAILVREDIEVV